MSEIRRSGERGARGGLGALLALVALTGCAQSGPREHVEVRFKNNVEERAFATLKEDCPPSFVEDPELLSPGAIARVGGLYGHTSSPVSAGGGVNMEFGGLRLVFRASPRWTSAFIGMNLRCHQALRLLPGTIPAADDDPYVLPGHWISISIESGDDGIAALLVPADADDAQQIARRVRAFLSRR